jgi:hypothetical protein
MLIVAMGEDQDLNAFDLKIIRKKLLTQIMTEEREAVLRSK